MGQGSKISWCHDTWNYWIGCTQVSAECAHCYAAELDDRRFSRTLGGGTPSNPIRHWGPGAPRHVTADSTRFAPLQWNKKPFVCRECGLHFATRLDSCPGIKKLEVSELSNPDGDLAPVCGGEIEQRRVFTASLNDWADEEVPDFWRDELFSIADQCLNLTFLFLTKRPENALRYLTKRYGGKIPKHFWGGLSWMKDKPESIKPFLATPWAIRFLSVEPMLGPVELDIIFWRNPEPECANCPKDIDCECGYRTAKENGLPSVDWVIFGGESGDKARPCNVNWIADGVGQCIAANVAPFVKQVGSRPFGCDRFDGGVRLDFAGNPIFHDKQGANPAEWPMAIRIQELPL